ncbi:transposase B [Streptomyces sp. 769]|nr:transposase B [Streptomyces sp. 769]
MKRRTRPGHLSGDKAYSSRRNCRYLRCRQIKHALPEPRNQRADRQHRGSQGGRPTGFDKSLYKRRNEVERTVNAMPSRRHGPWRPGTTRERMSSMTPSSSPRSGYGSGEDRPDGP